MRRTGNEHVTDLYIRSELITNGGRMEMSRNYSSFSSTNDLNLSPSRKRTITKGKTINPHEDPEPSHSGTASTMVSRSAVSCQTRSVEFYCLNNNEEGIFKYLKIVVCLSRRCNIVLLISAVA